MTKTIFEFVVFMTVSLCLQNDLGVSFQMEISPDTVNGLLHTEVSIECRLDSSDNNVKEIMILDVAKGGNQIAVIHQTHKVSVAKGLEGKLKAEGSLSTSDVNKSYLRVTLTSPQKEDAGLYKCQLYYLDNEGLVKDEDASATLTVTTKYDDQIIVSTLRYLAGKVTELETQLDSEKNVTNSIRDEQEHSRIKETQLRGEILSLTNRVKDQESEIQSLKQIGQKGESTEMFTAVFGGSDEFQKGDVIVFSHVITNQGQGYDHFKGTFAAPVAGFYLFHLSIMVNSGKYIYVDLKTNKDQILTQIFAGGYQWEDYSDGSCVAKLEAGEQVKPVVSSLQSGASFYIGNQGLNDRINKFSGFLLKTL